MAELSISANVLILNEIKNIDGLVDNLIDAHIDEIIFLDGGSKDGSFEKLYEYDQKYEFIHAYRWPQPAESEYRGGFREKNRRNFMMSVSSMDYILYIDADERIDIDFKKKLCAYDLNHVDALQVRIIHFWNGKIRINTSDDMVWSPGIQYRIVSRESNISYQSNDKNGLHNFLSKNGIKILNESKKSILGSIVRKCINRINGLLIISTDINIYHLHYYNIKNEYGKKNDLRMLDFKKKEMVLKKENDGMQYNSSKEEIICLIETDSLTDKILKYR